MKTIQKLTLALAGVMIVAGFGASASAETRWQAKHPRRAEVNARIAHQNRRIAEERREGEITGAQAKDLHAEVHGVRAEERLDASTQGGHITKAQQQTLNAQLNATSAQIPH
jgi:hypothetical protein